MSYISFRQYWQLLKNYLGPQLPKVALLTFFLFANIALQLITPQFIRSFIDTAKEGGLISTLFWLASAFVVLSLLQQVVATLLSYTGDVVGWNATNRLRSDLFKHCLGLDMSFHNRTTPGDLIERIDGDVAELANYFSLFVVQVLGNVVMLVGINAVLLHIDWRLGLSFSIFSVISLTCLGWVRNIAVPHHEAIRETEAALFGFFEEYLGGREDIRSSGATNFVVNHLQKVMGIRLKTNQKAAVVGLIPRWIMMVIWTAGHILAAISSYYFFNTGLITIGTAYLIFHYTVLLFDPLNLLVDQLTKLQMATACIKRVESLFAHQSSVSSHRNKTLPVDPLSVEFDDVSFAYKNDEPILKNISFRLEPGRILGVIGRTGSGKTTLSRLIYRLYEYSRGDVWLGGIAVKDVPVKDLREKIGVVPQEVQLFQTSVRENLRLYDHSVLDEQLEHVLEEVALRPWLEGLPNGLNTILNSTEGGVSAGQAQLLGLARVFLKNPNLIILDEATSRLDPATESLIERAIDKLLENATGIIIAHHLKTIYRVDQILILDDGKVVEYGDRESLEQNQKSLFSQLLSAHNPHTEGN